MYFPKLPWFRVDNPKLSFPITEDVLKDVINQEKDVITILYGESGTGKNLTAKFMHDTSKRNKKTRFLGILSKEIPMLETLLHIDTNTFKKLLS